MIGEINRLGKTHPGFTESLVSQLNRVVPKITNSTPSAMQEVFHGTVELMKAFHGDAATRAKLEVSDALFEVAKHTIPSEHILEVVVPDTHPSADGKQCEKWFLFLVCDRWKKHDFFLSHQPVAIFLSPFLLLFPNWKAWQKPLLKTITIRWRAYAQPEKIRNATSFFRVGDADPFCPVFHGYFWASRSYC